MVPCLLRHAQLTCASPCLVPSKLTKKQKRAYRAFLNQDDILVGGGKQADLSVCLCPAPRAALNGAFFSFGPAFFACATRCSLYGCAMCRVRVARLARALNAVMPFRAA